jgi:hypothetical protein
LLLPRRAGDIVRDEVSIWAGSVRNRGEAGRARHEEEHVMAQYMLSIHSGGAPAEARAEGPTGEQMQHSMAQIEALEADMKKAGALVLSARLTEPDTATVVRMSGGEMLTTDGPFVESKEHLGGFYLIEANDLDQALSWASRTSAVIGKPIEVRALWGHRGA